MLHLLCPLVVCGECPESGSSGLGVATSKGQVDLRRESRVGRAEEGRIRTRSASKEKLEPEGYGIMWLKVMGSSEFKWLLSGPKYWA